MISLFGYVVVFIALFTLNMLFKYLPKMLNLPYKIAQMKKGRKVEEIEKEDMSGEVNAAISVALYMYFSELHDDESHIMTIKRVSKTYSPWSSKIYNMNTIKK